MVRTPNALILALSIVIAPAALPTDAFAQLSSHQPFAEKSRSSTFDAGAPSIQGLFADTIDDFRRLPSIETATILSVGAIAASVGRTVDHEATANLSGAHDMGQVFHAGESLGSARAQAVAAVATYAIGRATNHPRAAAIGADLISAQIVSQVTTSAIKMSVGRTRPDGTSYSFPSGHSTTTFATATVLQRHLGWKVGIPAYALATYVATSRIQVKRHFLSDVTFGAALGIVAGRSVTIGRGDARFSVSPAPVPGGGAVNFTLLKK